MFAQNLNGIPVGLPEISHSQGQKHVLWDHSDVNLWPLASKIKSLHRPICTDKIIVPNLKKFPHGVLEISCSKEWDGRRTNYLWTWSLWALMVMVMVMVLPQSNQTLTSPPVPDENTLYFVSSNRMENLICGRIKEIPLCSKPSLSTALSYNSREMEQVILCRSWNSGHKQFISVFLLVSCNDLILLWGRAVEL